MNCYNHNDKSAVGICRVCCRGVCSGCSTDLGHSLACRDQHEEEAQAMHALNQRSTKLLKATRKAVYVAPLFYGVCGAAFLVEGLRQAELFNLATVMGGSLATFGLAMLVTNMRAYGGQPSDRS